MIQALATWVTRVEAHLKEVVAETTEKERHSRTIGDSDTRCTDQAAVCGTVDSQLKDPAWGSGDDDGNSDDSRAAAHQIPLYPNDSLRQLQKVLGALPNHI